MQRKKTQRRFTERSTRNRSPFAATIALVLLMLIGIMQIHNYTLGKTLITLFLTVIAVLIIIFLALLVINFITQVYSFLRSIYIELIFRI